MIPLTRFNGTRFVINADLIKFVEETPDTIVTLRDGEKVIVREKADEIIRLVVDYVRSTRFPPLD